MLTSSFVSQIKDVYTVPDGMPLSVFNNKYSRVKRLVNSPLFNSQEDEGKNNVRMVPEYQTWEERITDVVEGSFTLDPRLETFRHRDDFFDLLHAAELGYTGSELEAFREFRETLRLSKQGVMAYAGRHLQHGDRHQHDKLGELLTNCSTALMSWTSFLLLLKGSGVGRDYSGDICWVDWDYMPECRFVLEGPDQWGNGGHPDYEPWIESLQSARHKYDSESEKVRWFEVEDSAEGWVKVVQVLETAAFHKNNRDHLFIFDFTPVRAKGIPIRGQQNRPASGPVPLIQALLRVASVKGGGLKPWKQSLFIDDYLASCVALGGIRRCLPSYYQVNTIDGWKTITDVVPGVDKVSLPEGDFNIKDLIDNGVQQTVEINTPDGTHVCTPEHRWLALDTESGNVEWVQASNLTPRHQLLRPKKI